MIEKAKVCIVAFMKARNSLVVWCREKQKNRRWWKYFLKLLLKIFCEHEKVVPGRPHIKWTAWKDNDLLYYAILLKVD